MPFVFKYMNKLTLASIVMIFNAYFIFFPYSSKLEYGVTMRGWFFLFINVIYSLLCVVYVFINLWLKGHKVWRVRLVACVFLFFIYGPYFLISEIRRVEEEFFHNPKISGFDAVYIFLFIFSQFIVLFMSSHFDPNLYY